MRAQSLERSCGGRLLGCCRALCILQLEAPGSPHLGALCACMMRQVSHDACASLASSQAKGQSHVVSSINRKPDSPAHAMS